MTNAPVQVEEKSSYIVCLCGCKARLLLRDYQIEWVQTEYTRAIAQYNNPKCEFGCTSRCIHGFSVFLGWEQRVGKTPAFLYFLHLTRQFLKSMQDSRWMKPIIIFALAKNEGDIMAQAKIYMPGQETTKVVRLSGSAEEIAYYNEMINKVKQIKPELTAELVFVSHYDSMGHGHGSDLFVDELNKMQFLAMVLDQAERSQNEDATRSKAIESLDRDIVIPVTGEPLNNPSTPRYLWYLLQHQHAGSYAQKTWQIPTEICSAGKATNRTAKLFGCQSCPVYSRGAGKCARGQSKEGFPTFRKRNASPVWPTLDKFIESWESPVHQHKIHKMLVEKAHMSRLTRLDLGFPEVDIEVLEVSPTQAQKENYLQFLRGIRTIVKAEMQEKMLRGVDVSQESVKLTTLTMTTWLTQALCMSPRTMYERSSGIANFRAKVTEHGGDMQLSMFDSGSAKTEALIKYFRSIKPNDKMIIFSHFVGPLVDELKAAFTVIGVDYAMVTGATSNKDVQKQVEKFNGTKSCRVMLASDSASAGVPMQGGLGENDTMYLFFLGAPYWNPGIMNECASRLFNMEMKNKFKHISLVGMVNGHSIDLESAMKLKAKQSIAHRVQDGEKTRSNIYDAFDTTGDFLSMLDKLAGE